MTEVERKCEALRGLFPPDVIGWAEQKATILLRPGEMVACTPFPSVSAVQDRLDSVLGPDNWSVSYDNPGEYTRCELSVRFEPGADWVTRVGLSNTKELDRAHAEALRSAARTLGIGRYLSVHVVSVEWDGQSFKTAPRLPAVALPEEYRPCGRERGQRLRQLVNQCATEAVARKFKVEAIEAARKIVAPHGYKPDAAGHVQLAGLQNRHAADVFKQLSAWLTELAAGSANPQSSPYYQATPQSGQEEKKNPSGSQEKPQAQTPSGQGETNTGEKTSAKAVPAH